MYETTILYLIMVWVFAARVDELMMLFIFSLFDTVLPICFFPKLQCAELCLPSYSDTKWWSYIISE